MSYGMRVWDANGVLRMDENSFTVRVVLSVLVDSTGWIITNPARGGGYKDISCPGINISNAMATVLPVANFTSSNTQFETEVLTNVVRVYNYNRARADSGPANVSSMRLIVVRTS